MGRQIDVLIEERVNGNPTYLKGRKYYIAENNCFVPYYSKDWINTGNLVEILRTIDLGKYQLIDFRWREDWEVGYFLPPSSGYMLSHHGDFPTAICVALLKAVGVSKEEIDAALKEDDK